MKLKMNGSRHDCDNCIYEPYCNQKVSDLINYAKKHSAQKVIWIPETCPIISKEKVEFT